MLWFLYFVLFYQDLIWYYLCLYNKDIQLFFNNPSLQDLIFWFCELVFICLNVFQVFHCRNKVTKKFNTNPLGGHHNRWLSKECFNFFIACLRVKNFEETLWFWYIFGDNQLNKLKTCFRWFPRNYSYLRGFTTAGWVVQSWAQVGARRKEEAKARFSDLATQFQKCKS